MITSLSVTWIYLCSGLETYREIILELFLTLISNIHDGPIWFRYYLHDTCTVIRCEKSYENCCALCCLSFKIVVFPHILIEKSFKSLIFPYHCLQILFRGFHAFPMQFSVCLEQNKTQICCSLKSAKSNCALCITSTTIHTHWEAVQRAMAAKLIRLT